MSAELIHLVEITAVTDDAGTTTVLRFTDSSLGYATRPTEVPASTVYLPCLESPGHIRREMAGTDVGGQASIGFGEIVLIHAGDLDHILDYGMDGQPLVLRLGMSDGAYPADFETVFTGTVADVSVGDTEVQIRVRDRSAELDVALQANRYGGTNVLPAGIDGTADIKDQVKPLAFGENKNASPVCVNTSKLIYQLHDGALASIAAVYDRGAALTAGAAYASQADMEANAPAAGQYRAWLAGGCIRLGSTPAGQLTADLTVGGGALDYPGQVLQAIALRAGLAAGDIVAADVAALDAAAPYRIALRAADETTALDAMERVAQSVGAWFGFDRLGQLRMGLLQAPAGAPVATFTRHHIRDLERLAQDQVPAWEVTCTYDPNWTVQDSDLAGAVAADRRTWLAQERRTARSADAAVKTKHRLARSIALDAWLALAADATAVAAAQLALHKVRRDTFHVTADIDRDQLAALDLGAVVRVVHPRYGMATGRLFCVTALQPDFATGQIDLTLWG